MSEVIRINPKLTETELNHLFVESMKYGFAKRGDLGDLYKNPSSEATLKALNRLQSQDFIEKLAPTLSKTKTFKDATHYSQDPVFAFKEDHGTTHISVLAPNGDAVSVTSTINLYFGSSKLREVCGEILKTFCR